MHIPAKRRPEFEAARVYEYPEHLLASLEGVPAAPGVYIFHAAEGELPLYIGKSINLRARLLSHFRTEDEARMLRQAARISFIRTAGEIGALLLEAQLIKQQQPLFNQKLRRNRQLCALQLASDQPQVIYSRDIDFASTPDIFGLYASRHSALEALRDLADQHKLCYGALGLEKLAQGRACFRSMVRQCAGVCHGAETAEQHRARLIEALEGLRVVTWPFAAAVGIEEKCEDMRQIHVIHNWCYLGSAPTLQAARKLNSVATGFDADGYKILCRPILDGSAKIIPL
ncbi:excinuclease Cho [Comamonas sp. A7-5]|uniref:excinuclease Cho n=1 Tax=Comamonas sp. A7-5 TaxID=673549 RepID=UPI0031D6BF29